MTGGQFASEPVASMPIAWQGDFAGASERFHGQLAAAGFARTPICVIGAAGDAEQYAEVFEEETPRAGMPARFLVRLMLRDECEHLFTLADLPDLLEHFDRLAPLVMHAMAGQAGQARQRQPRAKRAKRNGDER